jgi:hypothetical protein
MCNYGWSLSGAPKQIKCSPEQAIYLRGVIHVPSDTTMNENQQISQAYGERGRTIQQIFICVHLR